MQIKFKVWDKKNNCWLKVPSVIDSEGRVFLEYIGGGKVQKDVDVVLWTGLLDKNGKGIFEGDIVKNTTGVLKSVRWLQHSCGWSVREAHHGYKIDFEIIGNIYENPELLK